jgi:hypothetical protein
MRVTYLSTNNRLIIWERICRNYYRSSLSGNGWMHNLQLMRSARAEHGHLTPIIKLSHSSRRREAEADGDGGAVLGRFRYYHRIRYLTLNYSLDKNDGKDMKWLSLTHLHLIMPPSCPKPSDMIKSTISNMPILTSLTLQIEPDYDSISIPSNSTLTSLTVLTPFNDNNLSQGAGLLISNALPNLRILTIGSGVKVNQCMDNAVPCLEHYHLDEPQACPHGVR